MYLDLNIPWPVDCFADIASGAKRSGTGKHNKRALGASRAISAVSVVNNGETHDGLSELQRKQVKNILEDLTHFGFTSIAFNHIVQTRYRGETNHFGLSGGCVVQPPDAISLPVFPHLASTGPRLRKPRAKFGAGLAPQLQQLQRLTVTMDDSSLTKGGHGFTSSQAAALATWDLIAVQPTTDSAFSLACQTLTELKPFSVDIISLELASSSRLPFAPKRSTLRTAIRSGAVFEITYSAMLAGASEESEKERERKKRNLVSNTRDLLRLTGGKGIIISSGAATLLDIRGPKDVIAVASIFGMSPQAAKDSISATARAVLTRARKYELFAHARHSDCR
ncbi:PHP domain-like protein [Ceraceosorus guamensis]|uniref:PHP domain-like protein n=1 Tax=Ceraceosorus guamensis TaxID=1522189 RepID=A0A316VRT5_9BASI|nr:PHP domain-like protein [Ceraceosorus guamensis]PWN40070.1 PHP domain-like protein [Ceraceosorus guamensis]